MQEPDFRDRRKSVRLNGRKEAILVNPNGIHHILNISSRGLAFSCPQDELFPTQLASRNNICRKPYIH